jgi:hypothetical protein
MVVLDLGVDFGDAFRETTDQLRKVESALSAQVGEGLEIGGHAFID